MIFLLFSPFRNQNDLQSYDKAHKVHNYTYHTSYAYTYSYEICKKIGINNYSCEKAGKRNSKFQDAADGTFDIAGSLFGKDSKEQNAVYRGW
jgi:hypothetical protein